jgi:hypothetical protein
VSDLVVSANEAPDASGSVVRITPESADWEYVGFEVLRLADGRAVERHTDAEEVCLVVLSGYCDVSIPGGGWRGIGRRDSVFEGPPYALYLPPGTDYTVEAVSYLELAVCSAPAQDGEEPFLIRPEEIEVEARGSGNAERRVHPILMDDRPAERLLAGRDHDRDRRRHGARAQGLPRRLGAARLRPLLPERHGWTHTRMEVQERPRPRVALLGTRENEEPSDAEDAQDGP